MGNRFGISAGFAGDGARVCREVMARDGVVVWSSRNGLRRGVFPALAGGGSLPSQRAAFFVYAVKFFPNPSRKQFYFLVPIFSAFTKFPKSGADSKQPL